MSNGTGSYTILSKCCTDADSLYGLSVLISDDDSAEGL